jgi:hypothetical protein
MQYSLISEYINAILKAGDNLGELSESIRRKIQDAFGASMFYSFENYLTVIDTSSSPTFFMSLEQNNFVSVRTRSEMNYNNLFNKNH